MEQERISYLVQQIAYHDYQYWILNQPVISDQEYDLLTKELRELDPHNPILLNVNDILFQADHTKIKHSTPMLSLDKAYNHSEIISFLDKVSRSSDEEYSLTPKYDGCAGRIYNLRILATRGNGLEGVDISRKIKHINIVTNQNPVQFPLDGELIFETTKFKNKIKLLLPKSYKTIRNCVAGLLTQLDDLPSGLYIDFVDYQYNSVSITDKLLRHEEYFNITINKLKNTVKYPIDGFVIRVKDQSYFESLGYTEHHPRGAIALKLTNPSAETTLINVIWQVGTTNQLTPVGIISPIELGQVEVNRINLYNAKYILDNDIHIGDIITVERAGDVIPNYIATIHKPVDRKPITINECPGCGFTLTYREPNLYCMNELCSVSNVRRLENSCKYLGLKLLGVKTLQKLPFKNIIDILTVSYEDIKQLIPGKTADNIYQEIQRIRSNPIHDYKILASLYTEGIGLSIYKHICKLYTIDELLNLSIKDLENINTIGPERAIIIYDSLQYNKNNIITMKGLFLGVIDSKYETSKSTICFTGKMPNKRSYYESLAEQHGLESKSSVTADLSVLVVPDESYTSSKVTKAKKFKIPIVTLPQFLNSINSNSIS